MIRKLVAVLIMAATSGFALGACSGGLSSEDAAARCDEERAALPQCITDAEIPACVACFEACGDACGVITTACPATFSCPE